MPGFPFQKIPRMAVTTEKVPVVSVTPPFPLLWGRRGRATEGDDSRPTRILPTSLWQPIFFEKEEQLF